MKICIVFFDIHEYNIKFLTNIEIIEYVFVNETIAKIICERLQFRAINFFRFKYFNCFNENKVKFIIHVIYSTFTIQNHNELIILMFITKIKSHFIILNKLWMYKHEIILNIKIDNLIFKRERCDHAKIFKNSNAINFRISLEYFTCRHHLNFKCLFLKLIHKNIS